MSTYTDALALARTLTDEQIEEFRQGCTELSCMYHGPLNAVRLERRKEWGNE